MNKRRRYKAKAKRRIARLLQQYECVAYDGRATETYIRLRRTLRALGVLPLLLLFMAAPAAAQVLVLIPSAAPGTPAEAARTLLAASPDLQVRPGLVFPAMSQMPVSVPAPRPPQVPPRNPFPRPATVPWVHVGQSFTPVIDVRIIGSERR